MNFVELLAAKEPERVGVEKNGAKRGLNIGRLFVRWFEI